VNPIEPRAGAKTALLRFAVLVCAVVAIALPASAQVVCLGASNTAGKGVLPGEAYPAQLEAMLQAKGYSGRVSNQGVSGDTTGGMLARLDTAAPAGTRPATAVPSDDSDAFPSWAAPNRTMTPVANP